MKRLHIALAFCALGALYACATAPVSRIAVSSPDAEVLPPIVIDPGNVDATLVADSGPPRIDAAPPRDSGPPAVCTAPPTAFVATPVPGLPASFTHLRVSPDGLVAVGYDSSALPAVYERASASASFGAPVSFLPTNYDWDSGFSVSPDGLQVTVVELNRKRLASLRRTARGKSFVDTSGVPTDVRSNNPVLFAAGDTLSDPVLMASGTTALLRVNTADGIARGAYQVSIDSNASGTGTNPLLAYAVNPFTAQPNAELTGFDEDQYALYFSAAGQSYVMFRTDYPDPFSGPIALGAFEHATPAKGCGAVYAVGALGPSVYTTP